MYSNLSISYPEIFIRVIKAGFGQTIKAVTFPTINNQNIFLFYLEGKDRLPRVSKKVQLPPFVRDWKKGLGRISSKSVSISYWRKEGVPIVVIIRHQNSVTKANAYRDADKVYADIVTSFQHR